MKQKNIIPKLIELAKKSKFRSRHACMIFTEDGEELARSYNLNMKSDFVDKFNPIKTLHAEALAVLKCRNRIKKLRGSTMYVIRLSRISDSLVNSKPCPMCQRIIKCFGIKKVFYSNCLGQIEETNL